MANLHLVQLIEVDKNRVNVDKRGMVGDKRTRMAKSFKHVDGAIQRIGETPINEILRG